MLRTFITYEESDVKYSQRLLSIIENLANQMSNYDPIHIYEWYLNLRAVGGTFLMNTTKWPDFYLYMTSITGNVRGAYSDKGDQSLFIITPCSDGTFLISPKQWPNYYVSMNEKTTLMKIPNPVGLYLDYKETKSGLQVPQDAVVAEGASVTSLLGLTSFQNPQEPPLT